VAGLVGVISHDRARPLPAEELAGLAAAYRALRGAEHVERVSLGRWAHVARIDGRVAGRTHPANGSWTLCIGALHADGDPTTSPLEQLDGQFAAIRFDAATDRLSIVTDPFGMQALYVCERDGRTYVSTSSAALARHLRAEPDPLGLRFFLRAGYHFGPLTHWQGIERLDPATVVTFGGTRRERRVYWLPQVDERVRGMTYTQTVDHCADVALATVGRRLGAAPLLWADLTGGFDSRLVVALLQRLGVPFRTATTGDAAHPDVVLAGEVARAGRLAWQHDQMPDGWSLDPAMARSAIAWGDGSLELLQLGEVLWRHEQKSRTCATVVTGGGGEHASARPWLQEFLRAGRSQRVNFDRLLGMRYLPPFDLSMLRSDPTAEVQAYCRASLGARADLYAGELNTTKLDAIYAYKSTGHVGTYRSASEAFVRQEIPFYYRDFFTACFSAHHRWRNGHRLQRGIIQRLSPELAPVPTTLGGPAEPMRISNAHRFLPYYRDAADATLRKLRRSGRTRGPGTPPRVAAARAAVVRRLRDDGTLDPRRMRSAELYAPGALDAFLARAARTELTSWQMAGRIATLELLLRAADPTEGG
jgi:hypothetical protein